jgi:ubiquinol-cytochrome c reductase cytochrome b subunit
MSRVLKRNPLLKIFNSYFYDSLLPININYAYGIGSIMGVNLIIQIFTGIFLAFHYVPEINLAFNSVETIMREIPYGYMIRYIHANGASLFFFMVYLHIARGLYYGSYISRKIV